ncbi:MAG: hypothetical protein AAB874_03470 [Patescibacteria group bacterium]
MRPPDLINDPNLSALKPTPTPTPPQTNWFNFAFNGIRYGVT